MYLSKEQSRLIAIGLYRQIDTFIKSADQEDYMAFKAKYLATQSTTTTKQRNIRKGKTKS